MMSIGWSSDAQDALLEGCPVEWKVEIVVDGGGTYNATNNNRVLHIGSIENNTSMIEKDWRIRPVVVRLRNDDAYFTPNYFTGSRTQITNVYQYGRGSGEADPEDCEIHITLVIVLPDGSIESNTYFEGIINELNFPITENKIAAELVCQNKLIAALEKVLTYDDGDDVTYNIP